MSAPSPRTLTPARWVVGGCRRVWALLSSDARRRVEDRFFYAIFNVTRVTNDGYGWRPDASPLEDEAGPGTGA